MRSFGLTFDMICFVAVLVTAHAANPPLLTPDDLAVLDKESGMWRAVRTDLDVSANLKLLRNLGYQESDITWFRPRLEELWQLPGAKSLGVLSADTREKISEVERAFVSRYRDARRFEETGIRPKTGLLYTKEELNAMWQKAIVRALSYEEMRDYGLVRTREADRVARLTAGFTLTSNEQKELIQMARDFGDVDNAIIQPRPTMHAFYEARLEYYSAIRDLLGDERFGIYLERANEEFLALRQVLDGKASLAAALDLFWLRLKTGITISRRPTSPQKRLEIRTLAREEASKILAPDIFKEYLHSENAQWLYQP